jgi:hypothetical protein
LAASPAACPNAQDPFGTPVQLKAENLKAGGVEKCTPLEVTCAQRSVALPLQK